MKDVSIVIPTYGRPDKLASTLGFLALQNYPRESFEIIVVENPHPTRPADDIVKNSLFPVRHIKTPDGMGLGYSLDRGLREAEGRVVIFLDEDMEVGPDFVRTHAAVHGDNAILAQGYVIWDETTRKDPLYGWRRHDASYFLSREQKEIPFDQVLNNNMSIRRDVAIDAGGFNSIFHFYWEETEFAYRMFKNGVSIVFLEQAWSLHHDYKPFFTFLNRAKFRGSGAVDFYRLDPELDHFLGLDRFCRPSPWDIAQANAKRKLLPWLEAMGLAIYFMDWYNEIWELESNLMKIKRLKELGLFEQFISEGRIIEPRNILKQAYLGVQT